MPYKGCGTCPPPHSSSCDTLFFFFFSFVTGPRRSLSLKLSDTRVYEPQIRARLVTTAHFCEEVALKLRAVPLYHQPGPACLKVFRRIAFLEKKKTQKDTGGPALFSGRGADDILPGRWSAGKWCGYLALFGVCQKLRR